jgi:hypothetical protein
MKKTSLTIALVIATAVAFLTSCTKDSNPPTISFKTGAGYTSSNVTVDDGTEVKFGISAQSGSAQLKTITITATDNTGTYTLATESIDAESLDKDYAWEFYTLGETHMKFVIEDADGQTAELTVTVTVQESINTFTAILLGGQLNPDLGSFYSTGLDSVMYLAAARNNSEKIDLVYYYGTNNKASIVAVADSQLGDVPQFAECTTWATKNATLLKLTSGLTWNNILIGPDVDAAVTNLTDMHVNQLAIDDIVAFQTASTSSNPDKKGLFKVLEINGTSGADRSMKIEVKIKK